MVSKNLSKKTKRKSTNSGVVRKATPEEVAYYGYRLNVESARLRRCKSAGVQSSCALTAMVPGTSIY